MENTMKIDRQHRYPWAVIETAVQMHTVYNLPYRTIADKMGEMGVEVSHKTIFEWVQKFSDQVSVKARRKTSIYDIEESFVKCNGELRYMYRAHDKRNATLGVFLRERKNTISAKSFFKKTLENVAKQ